MARRPDLRQRGRKPARYRLLMAAAGIGLFVAGFILTLSALAGASLPGVHGASEGALTSSEGGSQEGAWIITGLIISLAGLILATVGPAISYLRTLRHRA